MSTYGPMESFGKDREVRRVGISTGDGENRGRGRLSHWQRGGSILDLETLPAPGPQRMGKFSLDAPHSFCTSEPTSLLWFFFEQSLHLTHLFIPLETYPGSLSSPPPYCHGICEPATIDLCSEDPISLQTPRGLIVR